MTNANLVYLVPSRGRPTNIAALVAAWNDTTDGDTVDLVVAVDDDDPTLDDYRELELEFPECAELIVGPRRRLGGTLNALAPGYAARYSAVGFMGDDHRPRTRDWHLALADELEPGAVIYADDLVQREALPTAVLLDALIINTLGYFVPTGMVHLWLDNYWLALGRHLGTLRYRRDVVIEHVHPCTGAVEWDDGYRENNAATMWAADEARFHEYMGAEFAAATGALRAAIVAARDIAEARNG